MLYNSNYYSLKKDENVYIQCVFCVRNSIDLFNYKIKCKKCFILLLHIN